VNSLRPTLETILTSPPEALASLSSEVVTQLLIESTTVAARLAVAQQAAARAEPARPPRESADWLSIDEAAKRLGKSRRWIFKKARERKLPFASRNGRTVLCSAKGIEKYLVDRLAKPI
jgi:excisionase family DNA binding protein